MNEERRSAAVRADDPRGEAGTTIVELLVATLVISLAVGGLYASLYQSQTYFEAQEAAVDQRQHVRVAMDQLVTELRHTGYDTGSVDDVLSAASDTTIEFAADIDDGDEGGPCDGTLEGGADGGAERVRYSMNESGQLLRSVDCWNGTAWIAGISDGLVLDDLDPAETVFRFYDAWGTQVPLGGGTLDPDTRELVRSVQIVFQVEDDSVSQQVGEEHTSYRIESRVRLHNVGNE